MPSRNRLKTYAPDSYYHVYNRGINKRVIFKDDEDFSVFLNLLKRYLSHEEIQDSKGRTYPSLSGDMELLAFCLMPNHFHLCIYQKSDMAIKKLLQPLSSSYSTYFNKKYQRIGPLFQDTYKASMILTDNYATHISRYIHLNPTNYKKWPYSSLDYYLENKRVDWVKPGKILEQFGSVKKYSEFLADYENYKAKLDAINSQLADH